MKMFLLRHKYYVTHWNVTEQGGMQPFQSTLTCSKLTIETPRCEICSKLTIKTPERHASSQWRRSGVFIVNFEHISHVVLVFLLLTLNM